ncbi:ankyrin repeat domain-containing protein [Pyxidicoccus sp. MSG2]|nr:ankyrin repeat domain-containing protein [Pyxidicoccus sp. MSG2]MCY1016677.1 ankyrin repeat domain-containing protein [Pyxidicoccus sp. MSG2]
MYLVAAVVGLVVLSLLVRRVLRSRGDLVAAIRQGNAARVEALLRRKPEALTAARESVRGPLQAAASQGSRDIVELLLARGVDPAGVDGWGQSALHVAALHGHTELVRRFLELGVDVNQRARRATSDKVPARPGATGLHFACGAGQLAALEVLLEKGAAWDAVDERDLTGLHEVAARSGSVEVARRLLELGCAVDALDCLGQTPLMLALAYKRTALASLLVAHGASPHARGRWSSPRCTWRRCAAWRTWCPRCWPRGRIRSPRMTWGRSPWTWPAPRGTRPSRPSWRRRGPG